MGHDQHRALIFAQRLFQPGDAFRIQMVRRFVKQQQIWLFEQQAAKRDPAPFTARKIRNSHIRRRAAQRIQRNIHLPVHFPAIHRVNFFLQFRLFGQQGVHLLLAHFLGEFFGDFIEASEVRGKLGKGRAHILAHCHIGVELRFLRQIANLGPLRRPSLTAELLVLPRHDAHQRGFTCAVWPQHADLGGRQEGERDAFEDLSPTRIGLGEVLHDIDVLIGGHGAGDLMRLGCFEGR